MNNWQAVESERLLKPILSAEEVPGPVQNLFKMFNHSGFSILRSYYILENKKEKKERKRVSSSMEIFLLFWVLFYCVTFNLICSVCTWNL